LAAEQAQFNPGDQVTSIDGIVADSYDVALRTLKERNGKVAEFVVKRKQPPQGSRSFDYLLRQVEVGHVFEVTGNVPKS
jgi:hypothetical protein